MRRRRASEWRNEGFTGKGGGFYKNVTDKESGCVVALQESHYNEDKSYFSVSVSSLPKLIYKTNVEMLNESDLPFLPDTLNEIVANETRIEFDANYADVLKNDFCHNYQLQSEADVYAYRDELMLKSYPHKRLDTSEKEHGVRTIYYRNGSEEIVFYPKHAETAKLAKKGLVSSEHLAKSIGMLRWERRLLTPSKVIEIADRFGCSRRVDSFLPLVPEMFKELIVGDMEILGLDRAIEITGERQRLDRLKEHCGSNTEKYQSLSGLLLNCWVYGSDNINSLVQLERINKKTLMKRLRELRNAGISLVKPTEGRLLDRLPLPTFDGDDAGDQLPFNKTKLCSPRSIMTYLGDTSYVN